MAENSGMRPSNKSRSRNKPGGNGNNHNNNNNNQRRNSMGNIINRVFESAGPDGKVRGTPQQIIDKYQALARDAQLSGDRVAAESYLQHSEHYSRLLGEAQRQQMENRVNQDREDGAREDGGFDQQRRPQPQQPASQPVASGLAMIEPDDSFDLGGPIETPEGRRSGFDAPLSADAVVRGNDGGGQRDRDREGGGRRDRERDGQRGDNGQRAGNQRDDGGQRAGDQRDDGGQRGNGRAEPAEDSAPAEPQPVAAEVAAEPAAEVAAEPAVVPAAPKRRPRRPRTTAEAPAPVAPVEAE
jgi:hypothetical protein